MQHIRASFDSLIDNHPAHRKTLEAGLLLALAGRVGPYNLGRWTVKGGTVEEGHNHEYTVTLSGGHRWSCNCKAHEFQAGHVGDLLGYSGKVCKHVAAVAIVYLLPQPPTPPKSLFEMVHRLVQAQWMPAPPLVAETVKGKPGHPILGQDRIVVKRRDLDIPGTKAKLNWGSRGEGNQTKQYAYLTVGRKISKPLVEWVTLPGQTNKGIWQLVPEARERYDKWVESINLKK